jgi:5S rRNA maturation endonuclease (ribonuclease M5)
VNDRAGLDAVKAALARMGAVEVCRRLNLDRPSVATGGGLLVLCPWHGDGTPSCKVDTRSGAIVAFCHACKAGGDALALVAAVHGLDPSSKVDFPEVLKLAAQLAGVDLGDVRSGAYVPPPARPAPPPRALPPAVEVAALWAACGPVTRDPEVAAWLQKRGLEPERVDAAGLARALPVDVAEFGATVAAWLRSPHYLDLDAGPVELEAAAVAQHAASVARWAAFQGDRPAPVAWAALGYRCVVPMFDAAGELVSVRARNVAEGEPKALPPKGWTAKGMVMANPLGRMMLALGAWPWWAAGKVVIAEGEPDWLTLSLLPEAAAAAVLGLGGAGGWTGELAARVPSGSTVRIWTDLDDAGDRYAERIAEDLQGRCTVTESEPGERAARRATRPERERAARAQKLPFTMGTI